MAGKQLEAEFDPTQSSLEGTDETEGFILGFDIKGEDKLGHGKGVNGS
jgi:hypothetical protein